MTPEKGVKHRELNDFIARRYTFNKHNVITQNEIQCNIGNANIEFKNTWA